MRIVSNFSGHTLFIQKINPTEMPKFKDTDVFTTFYIVRNWAKDGHIFMYLGKGYKLAPKEICVWYSKGNFWGSYGKNLREAIEGAQKDGWLYA